MTRIAVVTRSAVLAVLGVLGGLGLGACEPPSPTLRLRLAEGPAQMCPSTNCAEVDMACSTWISIRIVDPGDPQAPYLSQCVPVPANNRKNVCAMASVDLEAVPLPLRDLEVQVAVYHESAIVIDPMTGEGMCPANVQYDAVNGFPVPPTSSTIAPALGGRTYYRPGDEEIIVTLGCTNLEAINAATCEGAANVMVAATVEDFDLRLLVGQAEASRLSVGVGEPSSSDNRFVLNPGDVTPLDQTGTMAAWTGEVDALFMATACLSVLDDTPQSTTSLTCQRATVLADDLTFTGVRLAKSSLDQILATLGLTQFPAQGLTLGLVLDRNGNPLANQVVQVPGGTIQYLSADRNSIGGTATTASGVFVSQDAPFGTMFSTTSGQFATATALGGLVDGKLTITILRFDEPVVGGT